jgi:hypothetical protein
MNLTFAFLTFVALLLTGNPAAVAVAVPINVVTSAGPPAARASPA